MNSHHKEILGEIKARAGGATGHTFLDSYLGNVNPRYPVNAPALRLIAKNWMRAHRTLSTEEFCALLDGLVKGKSSTEKVMAGILLDRATPAQRKFDPVRFTTWLDHLTGWAEVDAVCTGKYCIAEIPANVGVWKKILTSLARSANINKRRASIVFLCSPLSQDTDPRLAQIAIQNVQQLKKEKEVIITRAISWVLRSMVRHHRKALVEYLKKNEASLPTIAVRETKVKLRTGRKTG